jgi:crotonobetainyl-CoA:carnitine CoA-transferase CaiB-like acyl-CoA transferase
VTRDPTRPPVLAGLQVVDLSWGVAGPLTTMLLGDHGADVIKVEPPGGDPFRATAGYTVWNRTKRSVVLDLHDGADRARCRRLLSGADVVVESFAPGTAARLGVGYDTVRADNDGVVYCSISAYGQEGAARDRPGYDALVQARWGIQDEQPGLRPGPVFLHAPLPSFGAALLASVGVNAVQHPDVRDNERARESHPGELRRDL